MKRRNSKENKKTVQFSDSRTKANLFHDLYYVIN